MISNEVTKAYDKLFVADRLKRASVGIAGAGGLGSNIAMALASSGIIRI